MAEVKIAAAKMIANYKFSATPETKLEMFKGDLFLITFPEVKLKVEKRN